MNEHHNPLVRKQKLHSLRQVFDSLSVTSDSDSRTFLTKVNHVEMVDGHSGRFWIDGKAAELWLDPNDQIRITMRQTMAPDDYASLLASHYLPGNLRFARTTKGTALIADTRIDGKRHLAESLREIRSAMKSPRMSVEKTSGPASIGDCNDAIDGQVLERAVQDMNLPEDAVVRHEDTQYEFRVRVMGDTKPVQMFIDRGSVMLSCVVLRKLPAATADEKGGVGLAAVADQALRLNSQLRHVRLVVHGECLQAETRLHGGQIDGDWLSLAAHAVAVATRCANQKLRILVSEPEVAARYVQLFCSR